MCVLIFTTKFSETFLILRRVGSCSTTTVQTFSYKIPIILVRFYWKLTSLDSFSENIQINFFKIRPVGAELFHADGRTDMTKLLVAIRNFSQAPKKWTQVKNVVLLVEDQTDLTEVRDKSRAFFEGVNEP